jgi:two-component system sporulation sensor kinase C
MDYVFLSTLCAIAGTITMLFIYIYLYGIYHEAHLGAWIVGWLIHFTRIALFESGLLDWKYSLLSCIVYQMFYILCATVLIYSAHLFINKPLHKYWLYGSVIASVLSVMFDLMQLSVFWKLAPPAWLGAIMLFCIGIIFISKLQIKGAGNYITGYAFILWSILTAIIPYFASNITFLRWITLLCGISRLLIASGILLVYFEKTRLDLVTRETQYRDLADNSIDVIYRFQFFPERKFEYISPSIVQITGYSHEEYYAKPNLLELLVHPDDLWAFKTYTEKPTWTMDVPFDYRVIHKDTSVIYIEQKFIPIYSKDGQLIAQQGVLRDVTARNNAKEIETLYDRLNMVGKMAVSIAHQIRNPLTTIQGYLQFRRKKYTQEDDYSLLIEEVDTTNSVINEYILLAQDKRADLEPCILNNVIHAALPLLESYASTFNVTIKVHLEDVPELQLDKNEIGYLLRNLVHNGVEAMPTGGELMLCTILTENEVILSISDQGSGIPENILNNFGTPFLTTKDMGTGLGLPICYRVATRNHAEIRVDTSEKGTTFFIHFSLPAFAG